MKNIKDRCGILILKTVRCLIHILYFIPIRKNRILFTSYLGEAYSCNPKYISEYLQKNHPGKYEIVWAFEDAGRFSDLAGVKRIPYKSLQWIYYEVTAQVIVGNNAAVWVPRRKGQLVIDTWHGGGCYKKMAADNQNLSTLKKYRTQLSGQETNLYLSSSEYFSENVVRKSFLYHGEILPSGMPRNDILFADGDFPPEPHLREKIAEKYGFDPDAYVVLFAPTWRKGAQRTEQLNAERLKEAVRERFGKNAVILGRGHHTESKMLEQMEAIMNFDQSDFLLKMKKHHEVLGSYENGHATELVCEYITNWVKGVRKETRGGDIG